MEISWEYHGNIMGINNFMVVFHRDRMESHARKTGICGKSWDIELDLYGWALKVGDFTKNHGAMS
jgi:hypothetical protein